MSAPPRPSKASSCQATLQRSRPITSPLTTKLAVPEAPFDGEQLQLDVLGAAALALRVGDVVRFAPGGGVTAQGESYGHEPQDCQCEATPAPGHGEGC